MRILIIGSVAAGTSVAAKMRRNDITCEITVYEKNLDISYSVCGIPYYIGNNAITRGKLTPRDPAWFKKRFDINIKTGHEVIGINPSAKTIRIKNLTEENEFTDQYDKLVLATGSTSIIPDSKGIASETVFHVRTLNDADAIKNFITSHKPSKAAIIGGGFIGLEMAENLSGLGMEVTLIEAAAHVMPSMDEDMAIHIHRHLIEKKVTLILADKAAGITDNGKKIITAKGIEIEADIILTCVGVRPETSLAKKAGVATGRTGAIQVNNTMQTSNPDIYAAGDCAESFSLITGKPVWRPLGSTANKTGRIAGDVLTGGNLSFKGILGTAIVKVFDITAAQTGLTEKEARGENYDIEIIHNLKPNQSDYFPGSTEMIIKAIADRNTGKILGVQIIGGPGVDKRIDVFATAITFGAKAEDLFHLDLAYAPPYSTTKDPVMYTGMILDNALSRGRKILTVQELIANRKDYTVIDVRNDKDYNKGHIEGAYHIPLAQLKEESGRFDKNTQIVVHCNKGVTGNAAHNLLINLGFTNVYNLSGGYDVYKITVDALKS